MSYHPSHMQLSFFLFSFLTFFSEFHIMNPSSTHPFPAPHLYNLSSNRGKKNLIVIVCPTVYPFVHTSLLANVHCNESLVWSEASGFCCTSNTGSSLGLLSDVLLLCSVMEIMKPWIFKTGLLAGRRWHTPLIPALGRQKQTDF